MRHTAWINYGRSCVISSGASIIDPDIGNVIMVGDRLIRLLSKTGARNLLLILVAFLVSGSAYQVRLLPRHSEIIYTGNVQSNGMGSGTVSFQMGKKSCEGPFAKIASRDSFGFFQTHGPRQESSEGYFESYGGSSTFKAILECTGGMGLRCDVEGGSTGAGICVDSKGKVFDVIYTPE